MTDATPLIPVFDGHNDALLSLRETGRSFFEESDIGHIDLPRAKKGGLMGGFFAVYVPDPGERPEVQSDGVIPVSPGFTQAYAEHYTLEQLARIHRLITAASGQMRVVTTAADIRQCLVDGTFAVEIHIEGAEAIDEDLDVLEALYLAGLRSVGPVWSRSNIFGHGVPFAFGQSPDTGPGLTDLGKELVRACNQLGIMVDLSHLNEKGFWDVAEITDAPLVASHSNVHAIAPSPRNLTDKQLAAIKESGGLVGLNFNVPFLRPDGGRDTNLPLSIMADHVDYLVEKLGIDGVALGSDFDGAAMPNDLADAAHLPNLMATLRERGYDDEALNKIGHRNWIRVLEATWGA